MLGRSRLPRRVGVSAPGSTRQRTAVARALAEADGFRSAQDLHDALRSDGDHVGLATVYRALQVLADAGEVDVLRTDDGEAVYRRCRTESTTTTWCAARAAVRSRSRGRRWRPGRRAVGAEHGFTEVSHTVEVFGTCASANGAGRRPAVRPRSGRPVSRRTPATQVDAGRVAVGTWADIPRGCPRWILAATGPRGYRGRQA